MMVFEIQNMCLGESENINKPLHDLLLMWSVLIPPRILGRAATVRFVRYQHLHPP